MTREPFLIGIGFLALGFYLVWQHFVFEWRESIQKKEIEREKRRYKIRTEFEKFFEYMKELEVTERPDFKSLSELENANKTIEKFLK